MLADVDSLDERASGAADQPDASADPSDESVDEAVDEESSGRSTDEATTDEGGVTLNQIVALLLAVVGLRIGIASLHDNSFFTHLATGRLILDNGSIPRTDPYSFTAHGRDWTVQSWGASVIYASIDRTIGLVGIRILIAACCVALTQLVWRLTSDAKQLIGRLAVAVPVIVVGAGYWVERPLIFSLVLLMAVLYALEDRLDPRWMLPVMWLWVNVHGSFPIALAAIVAFTAGRFLDRERPTTELRVLGWASLGTLLGGIISPLSYHLLVFPLQLLQRKEAFSHIAEWKPPTWVGMSERFFAFQLILALVLVLWRGRRWRNIIPVLLFGALSLQASRNIVHASLILIPAMVAAAEGLGSIEGDCPMRILKPVRIALIALLALTAFVGISEPDLNLQDYPDSSIEWLRDQGMLDRSDRLVTRDFVGNYLELKYGPDEVQVFMDDRVDMYPMTVIDQYSTFLDEGADFQGVLRDVDASAVLWDTDSPLGDWLEDPANGWTIVHRQPGWIVATPPAASD